MTEAMTTTVTTDDGVRLAVEADGPDDAPVLLLCNSLGTDRSMWAPQLAGWTATHRVVRFDQRGHGASDAPPGPYAVERLGRDAAAVLDAVGVDVADVCGLSLGGLVAAWLAIERPERVRRLVLADTAAKVGTADAWQARIEAVEADGMDAIVDLVLERFFAEDFRASDDAAVGAVAAMVASTPAHGYVGSCAALRDADLRETVRAVSAPTLVIVGSADAPTPPSDAQALVAAIAGARLVTIDGAGHLANLERPETFGTAVADFLAT